MKETTNEKKREKKTKYGHVGRPTNEEVNSLKKKKRNKIIWISTAIFLLLVGIVSFTNFGKIALDTVMGASSVYNSRLDKLQSDENYELITMNPTSKKKSLLGVYLYESETPAGTKFIKYLFEKAGYKDKDRYKWKKIRIYTDGSYMRTAYPGSPAIKIHNKYAGKTVLLIMYVEGRKTGKQYTNYLRLYIPAGDNDANLACNISVTKKNNKYLWPIGSGKDGKPVSASITQYFKKNNSTNYHLGLDIGNNGKTNVPIIASADGVVYRAVNSCESSKTDTTLEYGTYVVIEHTTSSGAKNYTIYAHVKCNSIPEDIKVNEIINAGTQIGIMGETGYSKGVHLHFEFRAGAWSKRNDVAVNPLDYVDPSKPYPNAAYSCEYKK